MWLVGAGTSPPDNRTWATPVIRYALFLTLPCPAAMCHHVNRTSSLTTHIVHNAIEVIQMSSDDDTLNQFSRERSSDCGTDNDSNGGRSEPWGRAPARPGAR